MRVRQAKREFLEEQEQERARESQNVKCESENQSLNQIVFISLIERCMVVSIHENMLLKFFFSGTSHICYCKLPSIVREYKFT